MTSSPSSKGQQALAVATQFAAKTSGHGYRNLVQTGQGSSMRSAVWVLFMLGAISGLGYHIYLLASQFFAYEKRVLTVNRLEPLNFPKVILCPTAYWSDYLIKQPSGQFVKRFHNQLFNASAPYFNADSDAEREVAVDEMLLDTYLEGKLPELGMVASPLDAFLMSCRFNNYDCTSANFSRIVSDRYGFCYIFKPKAREIFGGYDTGLTLTLAYEGSKNSYLTNSLRYSRSYIVIVNAYDKFNNFFRATPVTASVGFRTDISVVMKRISRLSSPKDACTDRHQVVDKLGDNKEYDYDLVNCVDMSLSREVFRKCGCVSDLLAVPPELGAKQHCMRIDWNRTANGSAAVLANMSAVFEHRNCQDAMIRGFIDPKAYSQLVASCQKACREDDIATHSAVAVLPASAGGTVWSRDVEKLLMRLWQKSNSSGWPSFLPALINTSSGSFLSGVNPADHVVQLSVFFATSTVTAFEEDWQYPTESFLSEGGGVLGLWVGASVLTVMEVLELLASLTVLIFYRRRDDTQPQVAPVPQEKSPNMERLENAEAGM